ncbi:MAG: ABC-2 transporter permease [Lachnospiraceae bacterium]|nr:ABC-2 transporter permease [Lachnospiraceae bacterium]
MVGLLYKEFVAVKGKKLALTLAVCTIAFVFLRMIFPGDLYILVSDHGEMFSLIDLAFVTGEFCILWCGGFIINGFGSKLVQADEKNKIRKYLCAMPVSKKTYVASKYIFVGISLYALFSLYLIWHVADMAYAVQGRAADMSMMIYRFSAAFLSLIMFLETIELPLFINLGREKSMLIKIGIVLIIGLCAIGYLLFGDLEVFERFDIEHILIWINDHDFELKLISILSPVVCLVFYALSYRIAVHFYLKKEAWDE